MSGGLLQSCLDRHSWHQHASAEDVARVTRSAVGAALTAQPAPVPYVSQVTAALGARSGSPYYASVATPVEGKPEAAIVRSETEEEGRHEDAVD